MPRLARTASASMLQQEATATASTRLPPGPWSVPVLGSLAFLWGLLRGRSIPDLLRSCRAKYGPLFLVKTGPVKQVWISDPELLARAYSQAGCAGRPVSFKDPFGNFLFLTREPGEAGPIRNRQKEWLEANLIPCEVDAAMQAAMHELWPHLDQDTPQPWPADLVRTAMYSAVTRALLGEKGILPADELQEFMAATKEYSEMRAKSKMKGHRGDGTALPPGAAKVREIIQAALARAGRSDASEALPLVVAGSIGGAQIFPTLLHWLMLRYAGDAALQTAAAEAASSGDNAKLLETIYTILRTTPYSVALGPPRKALADTVVDGMRIPEGALLFAMHPAIADEALGREASEAECAAFKDLAFGVGLRACLGQPLAEALLPAAVGALLRRYHVSMEDARGGPVAGEMRGQLMHPLDPPALLWQRRQGS